MAEDIRLGSKLRVDLVFEDALSDGTSEPIDLGTVSTETVRVWKPDGTLMASPPTLVVDVAAEGEAHIEFDEDELDQIGRWKAQGEADGYLSAEVSWMVKRNP